MEYETHHTTSLISVFDVWAVYDRNWRKPHYPSYEVVTCKVGSAFSLEVAERIVRETVRLEYEGSWSPRLHSLRIAEIAVGRHAPEEAPLSEYVYDRNGEFLDCRTVSWNCEDVFPGRKKEEIRFGRGDLVEVLGENRVYLGFVAEVPPSVEQAAHMNARSPFHLGADDDTYTVLTNSSYACHEHVDSLRIFAPMHRISPRTERRMRKAFNDFETFPMRMKIADTAAAAQMKDAAEALGWQVDIAIPRYEEDVFFLTLEGVAGFPDGLNLLVPHGTAWRRMDRITATFRRLAGLPAERRGYRLKGPGEDGSYSL